MQFSKEMIAEFKKIYEEEFREEITEQEALNKISGLVSLLRIMTSRSQ